MLGEIRRKSHGTLGAPTSSDMCQPKRTVSEVRASYRTALPQRLGELARELAHLDDGSAGDSVAEASLLAHRLRGTAATFGFLVVGECAGRIEDALRGFVEGDAAARARARVAIAAALEAAQRAVATNMPSQA